MRQIPGQPWLDDRQFHMIASLAHRESGIKLAREKKLMVQSRLRHRLRALKLGTFSDYADHVLSQDGAEERRFMISALTTNVSHFFREAQHFELMSERLIPVFRKRMDRNERIRIWSAGCSNGQEPYSIAMHLLRQEPALASADFRILGTDIDPHVIRQAKTGRYTSSQLAGLAQADLEQFTVASGDSQPHRHMTEVLKKIVLFKELNLISDWPMRFTFDAIFCRNVVIYFDQVTQTQLWPKFSSALAPSGLFFLGHSERILSPDSYGFRSVGPTAYSKCCEVSGAAR